MSLNLLKFVFINGSSIGNSSKVIGQLVKEEFVKKEKCLLIYNGVEKTKIYLKEGKKELLI